MAEEGRSAERATSTRALAFVARDGRVVEATSSFATLLGAATAAALTRLDELPAALASTLSAHVMAVLDSGLPALGVELRSGDAHRRCLADVIATPATAGAERMAVVVLEDATERHRAEDALRESEHRFRQIAENIKDVFFITDQRAFKLLYVNPAFEQVYGRRRQDLYDDLTALITCIHPEDRERVFQVFESARESGYDTTYRILRPDGSVVWVHDRGYPLHTGDGSLMTSGLVTDITAERKLREELVHAQKLESIGRLAGGIAHDFNNILTVVMTCTDIAKSMLPTASPVQEELASVSEAAERAAALTRQLLAFARRQVIEPTHVDLNELARNMRAMLVRLIGERITLEMQLGRSEGAIVWADRSQLEQVLLNLAVNARDAMPRGGRLTITIAGVAVGPGSSADYEGLPAGDYVRLAVEDEGEAIPPAEREHVFEPFFTTRGRGAGLGLATSHGIVAQTGGRMLVRADVDRGAIFEVLIPRALDAPRGKDASAAQAKRPHPSGQETILLVEDQAPVRRSAATILRSAGYHVLEASDGVDALDVASRHADTIHLLLTDVVMPNMGGVALAERFLALRARTRVLFTSGFTEGAPLELSSEAAFLPKPYMMESLLAKVRAVLDH